MSLLDELKKRQMNGFAPAAPAPTAAPTPMAAPAPAVGPTIANAPITFPGLNELGAAGAAEFNAPQPETYNAATLGAPDFDEPYIIPQAAQAYGNVPVNMPSNPLDAGNQIAPAFRTAQDAATPAAQPPNALLDLAEREGALGPKLTDIFSGRETAIAEGGTPEFLPQPTSVAGQAAQAPAPQVAPSPSPAAAPTPQAPQAGSGGLISFDTGARAGQTFFGDETGVGAVTQGVADQINQGFDDTYGTRSAGDISITGPDGQAIDPNSTRYDPARLTPAMQANVDAGRPPNVSASQVAGAERQMQQQEVERAADRAAAEYGKNLPLNGQSIGARDEKVAEFRAAYLMGQQGEAGKGSGGMTAYQAATLAQKDRDFAASQGAKPAQTKFQAKVAEQMIPAMNEWNQGGNKRAEANINKLSSVAQDLRDKNLDTRTVVDLLPAASDWARKLVNPSGSDAVDRIRGVAYQSLREILGAQFTEKEGKNLVDTYFNPAMDEETNAERLEDFVATLSASYNAKNSMFDYLAKNESMVGYDSQDAEDIVRKALGGGGGANGSPISGDINFASKADVKLPNY